MSTELNNFERIMAEKLSHYEEVPPAHIWTNIQKSKRKGLLFQHWKLAASVLLILISVTGTLWYLNQKDSVGGVTTHKNLNASQSANETMKDPSFDERNAKSNLNTASAEQETGSMTHIKPIKPSGLHSKHAFKQKIKTLIMDGENLKSITYQDPPKPISNSNTNNQQTKNASL